MLNLYIVFVVLKFFSWDRERALLKMGARRALIKMGARRALIKMGARRALLKMGARALLNVEGQPNLSNLVIIFRGLFTVSVC